MAENNESPYKDLPAELHMDPNANNRHPYSLGESGGPGTRGATRAPLPQASYFTRLYGLTRGEIFGDWCRMMVGVPTNQNCRDFVGRVHKCLDEHDDNLDFCRSHTNVMELCLRAHWNYSK